MELLQYTYYINLAHRKDRRTRLEAHLKEIGIQAQRVEAVYHEYGAIGCFESHIRCIEYAKQLKYPHICIIEDDFECTRSDILLSQLEKFSKSGLDWDVIMLGVNVLIWRRHNEFCHRIVEAQAGCAYIAHEKYYDTLLQHLYKGLEKIKAEPLRCSELAIDICWKELQPRDKWWVIHPLTINQYPNYSDIQRKQVDYTEEMIKDI